MPKTTTNSKRWLSQGDRFTLVAYKNAVKDAHKNLEGEDLGKSLAALKNYMMTYHSRVPKYMLEEQ